jgi:ribosome-binding factor A
MTRGHIESSSTQRQLQASEVIRQALSDIFAKGKCFDGYLFDKSITISNVKVSVDMKHANIYVLPFGQIDKKVFLDSLHGQTPKIRRLLTQKINFKYSPQISFFLDNSFDYADKINNLIKVSKVFEENLDTTCEN